MSPHSFFQLPRLTDIADQHRSVYGRVVGDQVVYLVLLVDHFAESTRRPTKFSSPSRYDATRLPMVDSQPDRSFRRWLQ